MVQRKLTTFKTGKNYNPLLKINMNELTPHQRMQLVYCRIWGTTLPDNLPSGKIYTFI
jgi:hypothetical protein